MADARRQLTGRRNKKNGDLWEEWICNALENLYTNSAVIEKTPEPFRMLTSGIYGTVTGYWKS